jgi:hypothetical protein
MAAAASKRSFLEGMMLTIMFVARIVVGLLACSLAYSFRTVAIAEYGRIIHECAQK